jgi:preprotein translocase subunit SecA
MGLDCDWMYGLGETELSDQLTRLISEQINVIRDQLGHESFDQQSRNVLAEQADELWPSHLNYLQDISLSCAIAGPTHRAAVGEFIEQSHGSFVNFLDNVNREAVPRLMELGAVESPTNHLEQPIVIDNEILSVLA